MSDVSTSIDDSVISAPRVAFNRFSIGIGIWFLAIALASILDLQLAHLSRSSGAENFLLTHSIIRAILKAPGEFRFTALVVVAIVLIDFRKWMRAIFVSLAAIGSGLNALIKWIVGRTRPFKIDLLSQRLAPYELHPFRGGLNGLLHQQNLCFPSGHSCLAFATAAALGIVWPRLRPIWFAVATVVAIERIAENAHWFSDTVAGAALGIFMARIAHRLLKSQIKSWTSSNPISR